MNFVPHLNCVGSSLAGGVEQAMVTYFLVHTPLNNPEELSFGALSRRKQQREGSTPKGEERQREDMCG